MDPRVDATDTVPALEAEQEIANATTGGSVLRGGIWNTASKTLPQFFTLVVSIAGARLLGASGLGRQSFIAFVATSAIYVLGLGIPPALMRQIGESAGAGLAPQARGLVRWAFRFSVGAAAIGLLGLTAVALGGAEPQAAWILAGFIVAVGVLTQIPDAIISGLQHWRDSSVVVLWSSAIGAVATVLVLLAGGGVTGMIAVQLAVAIPILLVMAVIGRRRLFAVAPRAERAPHAVRARTLRYAASVFVGTLATLVVFRRSEFFFLNHYATDRDIALYSVAFSVMSTLVLVPEALGAVLTPAVATLLGAGQMDRIRSGYARALRLVLLGSLPAVAVGLALGPELVTLVFGRSFRDSRIPLLILLAPFPLIPLMSTSFALIEGLGKVKFPLVAGVASAVVNIALDFALIPAYSTNGAAAANSIAQGLSAMAILVYGVRLVGGVRWELNSLARMAITSAVVGALAWGAVSAIGGVVGLIAGLALATAAFVLLCVLVRVISHDDAAWLRQAFGSMLGGAIGTAVRRVEVR